MAYIRRFAADNVREVVIKSRTLGVAEIGALARSGAGVGTSGVGGIQTFMLSGDPAKAGPYAIELNIPAHTHIAAHSHRDNRLAMVVSGE
jgi:hypothetical protein